MNTAFCLNTVNTRHQEPKRQTKDLNRGTLRARCALKKEA